jgi:hypothetical protein
VNDVRKLLKRPRSENRLRRIPIPQSELEEIWRRAYLESRLPRISL